MFVDEESLSETYDPVPEINYSIILLAAGSSSRMGKSKQMLPIGGEPLLVRAVRAALSCGPQEVVVVLGANEQSHVELLAEFPIRKVSNHYWKSGMGSSIKTGLHFLINVLPETHAVIIMVCDQPLVSGAYLKSLVEEYSKTKKPIVASGYAGTAGVPVLFARSFFSNILRLGDDHGAKRIVDQFPENRSVMEFPEGAIDLDTTEDYDTYVKGK